MGKESSLFLVRGHFISPFMIHCYSVLTGPWQDLTYNIILFHFLSPIFWTQPPKGESGEVFLSCQSVDGEDAGKRIFAHLFEEDIKKQAVSPNRAIQRDVSGVRFTGNLSKVPIVIEDEQIKHHDIFD